MSTTKGKRESSLIQAWGTLPSRELQIWQYEKKAKMGIQSPCHGRTGHRRPLTWESSGCWSQNHRMVWVWRDFKGHLVQAPALGRDTFCLVALSTRLHKAPSSLWSKCCQRWGIHHFSGQPVPVFHPPHCIKSFLVSSWIYPLLSSKSVLSAVMWMLWRGDRNSAHNILWRVRKHLKHHTDIWRESDWRR